MSKIIADCAEEIGVAIPQTEAAIDDAMFAVANLMATLVKARKDSGVPGSTGQATLMRLAKTQISLVGVSNDVLRVHGDMLDVGKIYSVADMHGECRGQASEETKSAKLRVVA
ncbi:MAG: hypothetical protein ACRCY3_01065 [Sphingorhabdus sp.]